MIKRLASLISFIPVMIFATELSPWFLPDLVFELRNRYRYQQYSAVAIHGHHNKESHASDSFDTMSLSFSPMPEYDFEVETTIGHTQRQRLACDNIMLTARYHLLDDITGDPVSLSIGLTGIQAFKHSVHDVSSFHHGKLEGEAHLAVGKEFAEGAYWVSRSWAVLALGMADVGYPWLRLNGSLEKKWFLVHQGDFFINTLWGFGGRNIDSLDNFKGYGSINHQSIDIGVRYSYQFDIYGVFSVEYFQRAFAYNFPNSAKNILVSYRYPIGLGL